MAVLVQRHRKGQGGVAALEFALSVPLLFVIVAGTFYLGMALFSRHVVTSKATAAVRACVIRQEKFQTEGSYISCATDTISSMSTDGFRTLCNGGITNTQARSVPMGGSLPQTKMLTLTFTCPFYIDRIVNFYAGGGSTTKGMEISASMPFILGRPANP